jgi:hypothetical protein
VSGVREAYGRHVRGDKEICRTGRSSFRRAARAKWRRVDRLNQAVSSLLAETRAESALRVHAIRPRVLAAHDWEFATDSLSVGLGPAADQQDGVHVLRAIDEVVPL